jgi:hypothetical protein
VSHFEKKNKKEVLIRIINMLDFGKFIKKQDATILFCFAFTIILIEQTKSKNEISLSYLA